MGWTITLKQWFSYLSHISPYLLSSLKKFIGIHPSHSAWYISSAGDSVVIHSLSSSEGSCCWLGWQLRLYCGSQPALKVRVRGQGGFFLYLCKTRKREMEKDSRKHMIPMPSFTSFWPINTCFLCDIQNIWNKWWNALSRGM